MAKDTKITAASLYRLADEKLGTPALPIQWAHLGTPQSKNPEFDGEFGTYRFDLVIDPETKEGAALINKLTAIHESLVAKAQQWAKETKTRVKYVEELNLKPQTEKVEAGSPVETGKLVLKLKQRAAFRSKKDETIIQTPIPVFDTQGNKVPKPVLDTIGNGTTVQVALDITPYLMNGNLGTSFKVRKVRLVELLEYGDTINDDDYFGDFDVVTSGFVATKAPADNGQGYEDDSEDTEEDF